MSNTRTAKTISPENLFAPPRPSAEDDLSAFVDKTLKSAKPAPIEDDLDAFVDGSLGNARPTPSSPSRRNNPSPVIAANSGTSDSTAAGTPAEDDLAAFIASSKAVNLQVPKAAAPGNPHPSIAANSGSDTAQPSTPSDDLDDFLSKSVARIASAPTTSAPTAPSTTIPAPAPAEDDLAAFTQPNHHEAMLRRFVEAEPLVTDSAEQADEPPVEEAIEQSDKSSTDQTAKSSKRSRRKSKKSSHRNFKRSSYTIDDAVLDVASGYVDLDKKPKRPHRKSPFSDLLYLLVKVGMVVGVLALVFTLIFGFYRVSDPYMKPAVRDGDAVLYYRLDKNFPAGTLAVVRYEDRLTCARVIAGGGDQVDFQDDALYINGSLQLADYNEFGETTAIQDGTTFPLTVPQDSLFLLVDNRSGGVDSRLYGCVHLDDVEGKVMGLFRRREL